MGKYTIAAISTNLVEYVWEDSLPWIRKVTAITEGDLTEEAIKSRLLSGRDMLVLTLDGSCIIGVNVMEIIKIDSGEDVLYVPLTAGESLDDWLDDFYSFAKTVAKDRGCTQIRGMVIRESWLRKLRHHGFERAFTTIKCKV